MKALATLFLVSTLLSQAPVKPTSGGQLQTLFVTVTNSSGEIVTTLRAEDFILEENGTRQQITQFGEPDAPISLGILIDKSTSMRLPVAVQGGERVSAALLAADGAARAVLKLTKPQDEYLFMTFDDVFHVKQAFTSDKKKLDDLFSKNRTVGGATHLYHAVADALNETGKKAKNRRRALIVITDVHDTSGDKVEELQAKIQASEIPVYTFGMRWDAWGVPGEDATPGKSSYEEGVLRMMAADSGGYSMVVDIPNLLTDYTITRMIEFISKITTDLRGQYAVTYKSTTAGPDTERAIRIRTTSPNYQVRFTRDAGGKAPASKK